MVSDEQLVERLREFLRTSDLNTTTTAIVRRRLEEDFGVDLSDKKAFVREQVDLFLQSQCENLEGGGESNEDEDGEDQANQVKSEETDSGDDEGGSTSNGKGAAKRRSQKMKVNVRKGGGGFNKLCILSPELQGFVGVSELARTEVVKQLWAYIREKNLQDPSNRRKIICDQPLHSLFGVDSIDMFQMNKALSKHIWPSDSDGGVSVKPTRKEKQQKEVKEEDEPKQKRQKGGKSGFLAPLPLSDALVKFLGTGESELSRADAVKRIWDYIKQNSLQDPSDKRRILCDEKLRELFDVESFNGFTVSKLLSGHLLKTEQ